MRRSVLKMLTTSKKPMVQVLKLSYDLRKSVTLFDMVKRREKTKMVVMDLDSQLLSARIKLDDHGSAIYNQYISRVRFRVSFLLKTRSHCISLHQGYRFIYENGVFFLWYPKTFKICILWNSSFKFLSANFSVGHSGFDLYLHSSQIIPLHQRRLHSKSRFRKKFSK